MTFYNGTAGDIAFAESIKKSLSEISKNTKIIAENTKNSAIKNEDIAEFVGQIIDIFEDFLDEKKISLKNEEKEDSESPANIYGTDYGEIQANIEDLLRNWDIIK